MLSFNIILFCDVIITINKIFKSSPKYDITNHIVRNEFTFHSQNIEYHQIEFLRSKFDPFINSSSGVIDKKDVTAVISLACPTFHPMMLEGFVADEFKNKFSSGMWCGVLLKTLS